MSSNSNFWQDILESLKGQMPKTTFDTWFKNTTAELDSERNELHVFIGTSQARDWFENRLRGLVERAVNQALEGSPTVRFITRSEPPQPPAGDEDSDLPDLPLPPEPPSPPILDMLSGQEIMEGNWPPPEYVVPNIVPVGLTVLAGASKIGKSFMALQLAKAVSAGQSTLGADVEQGPVTYLALEDTPGRLQSRMAMQEWPKPVENIHFMLNGHFAEQVARLDEEGIQLLVRYIEHERPRLLIVDTLTMAIDENQNENHLMKSILAPIRDAAHAYRTAFVLVDHHKKQIRDVDSVTNIFGATQKGAIIDGIIGMYRKREEAYAKLHVGGRDTEHRVLALSFSNETGLWSVEGDAHHMDTSLRQKELLEVLAALEEATSSEICSLANQDPSNGFRRLQKLVADGFVQRSGKGKGIIYSLTREGEAQL